LSKLTVPPGAVGLPAVGVSVTVAVQVVPWLTSTELGEQLTLVEVARGLTDTVVVLVLVEWMSSLGL
jgi:hypothetical protein